MLVTGQFLSHTPSRFEFEAKDGTIWFGTQGRVVFSEGLCYEGSVTLREEARQIEVQFKRSVPHLTRLRGCGRMVLS